VRALAIGVQGFNGGRRGFGESLICGATPVCSGSRRKVCVAWSGGHLNPV
jgi:hypothetical protein